MDSAIAGELTVREFRDDVDAQLIAHGIIQGCIGPDHKVTDMRAFQRAVQALEAAHEQGWKDGAKGASPKD